MEDVMELKSLIPIGRNRNVARREWNPFDTLQREIDRLFEGLGRGSHALRAPRSIPTIDVAKTDGESEITAELPGLEEKDVEVNVADNVLTIRGEKRAEKEEKDKNYSSSSAATAPLRARSSCPPASTPTRSRPASPKACSR
jgi:HSP20 family protein